MYSGDSLFVKPILQDDRYVSKNTFPILDIEEIKNNFIQNNLQKKTELDIKILRTIEFTILTLLNGRYLSDSDFPNNFKELVSNYINISIEGLYNQQIKKEYKEDFLLFLTYLSNGMNMPSAITKLLVKLSNSIQNNSSFQRHLSFAVGDVRLDWQKEIFNNILNFFSFLNLGVSSSFITSISLPSKLILE